MASKGIVYMGWGETAIIQATKSVESGKHTKLPTCLITDKQTKVPNNIFTQIIRVEFDLKGDKVKNRTHHGRKCLIYKYTPYDITLFLDTDTIILTDDLSFAFDMAELHNICLAFAPTYDLKVICSSPLLKHFTTKYGPSNYNSGVICFNKSDITEKIFNSWEKLIREYQQKGFAGDQLFLSIAIYINNYSPFVLNQNWNLRPIIVRNFLHGPIKICHFASQLRIIKTGVIRHNKKYDKI